MLTIANILGMEYLCMTDFVVVRRIVRCLINILLSLETCAYLVGKKDEKYFADPLQVLLKAIGGHVLATTFGTPEIFRLVN
jgi:hypothetical protein